MEHSDVSLGHFGLLGKLLAQEGFRSVEVAVKQPAYQTHGKHVAAFEHRLVVHTRAGKAVFHHLGDRGCDDILLDAHLFDGVVGLELGLVKIRLLEAVGVDDDASGPLCKFILSLQRCGVHGHQYVT